MGEIAELLAYGELSGPGECGIRMCVEQCEKFHFHYRDTRLEFEPDEFDLLLSALRDAEGEIRRNPAHCSETYFRELSHRALAWQRPAARYVAVELTKDGKVHVHYRNLRLEFTRDEFITFGRILSQAYAQSITRMLDYETTEASFYCEMIVPVGVINQYDLSHQFEPTRPEGFWCGRALDTKLHMQGIELCMRLLQQGFRLLPVAVTPIECRDVEYSGPIKNQHRYQRLDGFKRFEAHRRLGAEEIECRIYRGEHAVPGVQQYEPWVIG